MKKPSRPPSGKDKLAKKLPDPVTRDYTIHVAKLVHKIAFKKRAPRAIREIKKFATKEMGTQDVRIDTQLNKFIWSKGIRFLPTRVRVRMERHINDDYKGGPMAYTVVYHVPVDSFKYLQTETVAQREETSS